MEQDKKRFKKKKEPKAPKAEEQLLTGTFLGTAQGFGFLEQEAGDDIFIPESRTKNAMHGDKVQVRLWPGSGRKRPEGKVVKILNRKIGHLVGTYQKHKKFGFVIPDNRKFTQDIYVPFERSKGAVTGHKVVVAITDYGNGERNPEGKVIEILGHVNDPGTDILSIIKGFDLRVEFPKRVLSQGERLSKPVGEADMAGRKDIREWQAVTIDGEDAKDLDDAITISRETEHYRLGVHIADVSDYVQEDSALDVEAKKRGTSVYLVDRVIPMLPHALSNGICSLNAGEDRLALSCIMTIDKQGTVIDHEIAETVIQVDRRMTYTAVKKILEDKDQQEIEEYRELVPMFELMQELAAILREKRRLRGSIDFDFPESKIILDEAGKPLEIKPYDRNVATKIIEDFMLIANETVAQDYFWQELPFLYRTHETPDPEKIKSLGLFINNYGYAIKVGQDSIHPKELQKLLSRVEGTPQEALINRMTLRSMKQARYSAVAGGHFGLAATHYAHFTSPIRRYPDLQIHRIIKDNIRGRLTEMRIEHYDHILPQVAAQCSEMERRAEEAERETDKQKKVEYMSEHVGEEYDGVISGITSWGIYVELANTVDGLVHVSTLPGDYFYFDENKNEMVGADTGTSYKLGQKVRIEVKSTDLVMRTIDFILVEEQEDG